MTRAGFVLRFAPHPFRIDRSTATPLQTLNSIRFDLQLLKMRKSTSQSARALFALLLSSVVCFAVSGTLLALFRPESATNVSQRSLTFAERVAYQRAIEDVYWRHRMWPKERPDAKPSLEA